MSQTPVKIKKEEDSVLSPRSHLSASALQQAMSSTNGPSGGGLPSGGPGTTVVSGSSHQPIARKRTAYQAALVTGLGHSNGANAGLSESSPEVSSSQNCTGISPVPSLESSEIDLELWDLDIHESSTSQSSGMSRLSTHFTHHHLSTCTLLTPLIISY